MQKLQLCVDLFLIQLKSVGYPTDFFNICPFQNNIHTLPQILQVNSLNPLSRRRLPQQA